MADPKSLFTKAALERLSSPEQLDMLMRVTSPIGWLALDTVGVCLFIGLMWGIFGTIPNKVDGKGILIRGGSIMQVEAGATGRVTKLDVEVGDVVTQGQPVASISQSGLSLKIDNAKALLASLVEQNAKSSKAEIENSRSALEALSKERASTEQSLKDYASQLPPLEQKVKNQEELQAKGLITSSAVLSARNTLFSMQEKIANGRVRLTQITTEEGTIRKQLQETASMRETPVAVVDARQSSIPPAARGALESLQTALGDFDLSAATTALAALDRVGMPDAVADLTRLHHHVDSYEYDEARQLATRLLGQIRSEVS